MEERTMEGRTKEGRTYRWKDELKIGRMEGRTMEVLWKEGIIEGRKD